MKTFLKHKKQSTFRRFRNIFQKRSEGFYETFTKRTENIILLAGNFSVESKYDQQMK